MRRNSVYVTFVVAGAFVGERMVDSGVRKLWEYNNVGVMYIITQISSLCMLGCVYWNLPSPFSLYFFCFGYLSLGLFPCFEVVFFLVILQEWPLRITINKKECLGVDERHAA
ncbi:hypothetical protein BHE74_00047317 [Ensete ventricosum]|nr:hypothetical protein GW17_00057449 [Ensete ventricosum]RWW46738.1 hypothetical protein BHE74_00047317 [Ensete ventricosum]RZS17001.1 hypothetical protein BHM03_00049089 [Ensete ventricosum]